MVRLLRQTLPEGLPPDYLRARLRHKRQQLVTESAGRVDSRVHLQRDLEWLYRTMPGRMRKVYAPCFLLAECKILQMMLRAIAGQERSLLNLLGRHSLLNEDLIRGVLESDSTETVLEVLEARLAPQLPLPAALEDVYRRGGHCLVEAALVDGLLLALQATRQKKAVERFVAAQIDVRNLLTAARYLRWQLDEPPLLDGGGDPSRQLRAAGDRTGLENVVAAQGGSRGDVAMFESILLQRLSRRIDREARDPLGDGLVIAYIWHRLMALRRYGLNTWAGSDVGTWEEAV